MEKAIHAAVAQFATPLVNSYSPDVVLDVYDVRDVGIKRAHDIG